MYGKIKEMHKKKVKKSLHLPLTLVLYRGFNGTRSHDEHRDQEEQECEGEGDSPRTP